MASDTLQITISESLKEKLVPKIKKQLEDILDGQDSGDDILEYILLLLMNNRPKNSVSSDLEAFFGSDAASRFTNWLWDELKGEEKEEPKLRTKGRLPRTGRITTNNIQSVVLTNTDDVNKTKKSNIPQKRPIKRPPVQLLEKAVTDSVSQYNNDSIKKRKMNVDSSKNTNIQKKPEDTQVKTFKSTDMTVNDNEKTTGHNVNILEGKITITNEEAKKERCIFWPNCTKGDECLYSHPTEKCTFFPHCSFGDSCINSHPPCRFGKECTNYSCNYSHPPPRCNIKNTMPSQQPVPIPIAPFSSRGRGRGRGKNKSIQCKFGSQCSRSDCIYSHPTTNLSKITNTETICRYDPNCSKISCPFKHPQRENNKLDSEKELNKDKEVSVTKDIDSDSLDQSLCTTPPYMKNMETE